MRILDLEFGLGIWTWTWNLDLEFGLGIWTWNIFEDLVLGFMAARLGWRLQSAQAFTIFGPASVQHAQAPFRCWQDAQWCDALSVQDAQEPEACAYLLARLANLYADRTGVFENLAHCTSEG